MTRIGVAAAATLTTLCLTAYAAQQPSPPRDAVLRTSEPLWVVPVAPVVPQVTAPVRTGALPVMDPTWVATTAGRVGISEPALLAYARATVRAPEPCHLGWTTLAGIGWVESRHGTLGGRTLGVDGRPSSPILGPVLDGTGDVAAVVAPDAEAWDRAAGPLQFIASTWSTWATDGDGDGAADAHDIDDAAYAAARYLCADGDLATGGDWAAAVFSYNHAQTYVDAVHLAATTYADRTGGAR